MVIDVGTYNTRIGFAGKDIPKMTDRTAIAKSADGKTLCGKEAIA